MVPIPANTSIPDHTIPCSIWCHATVKDLPSEAEPLYTLEILDGPAQGVEAFSAPYHRVKQWQIDYRHVNSTGHPRLLVSS